MDVSHKVQSERQRSPEALGKSFLSVGSLYENILSGGVKLHHGGRKLVITAGLLPVV